MVIPPVPSVMPKPLMRSTPWAVKKRKTRGSRYPAADRPHFRRGPTTSLTTAVGSVPAGAASIRSRHFSWSWAQRTGTLMKPVGRTLGRRLKRVSAEGLPAKT